MTDVGAGAYILDLDTRFERYGRSHPSCVFRDASDDFWLWANTEGRDVSPILRDMLPGLPGERQQNRWTGKSGRDTQLEGFGIYRAFRDLCDRHFGSIRELVPVLDFGCGWGRVIRYFLKDVESGQLLGADYDQENVDFCRSSNAWCTFMRNEAAPPLPVDDCSVGYVYAYSVFSHFSEPMHRQWLEEFKRVLRPGGALAVTVRPRSFIENTRRLRQQGSDRITARLFTDTDAALARYDSGRFCFDPYNANAENSWWGEACIPRSYVAEHWSDLFDIVDFQTAGELKQHLVLLRA
jgi:SAM-dependent methyltransferase